MQVTQVSKSIIRKTSFHISIYILCLQTRLVQQFIIEIFGTIFFLEIRLKIFQPKYLIVHFQGWCTSWKFKCYKYNYQSLLTNMVRSRRQHKIVGKFRIYFNFSHLRFPFFQKDIFTLVFCIPWYVLYIKKFS